MILSCQNIRKSFGTEEVLRQVSFHLEERERAALIGINGAGKSTLLHILDGTEPSDGGEVIIPRQCRIGTLSQYQEQEQNCTILEEVSKARSDLLEMENEIRRLEQSIPHASEEHRGELLLDYERLTHEFERRDGYACRSEIFGVLRGLGFAENEYDRPLSTLSGGQKTRVVLARLLLEEPDILMLDEPTNHLDTASVSWLEDRLLKYPGTLLLVSHDRYFLDRLADKVIELENGRSVVYSGNYTAFREKKTAERLSALRAWEKQQAEIRHQEDVIRKLRQFNREKSIKRAESREKQLRRTELLEKPVSVQADMRLRLVPSEESGNDVCIVTDLKKAFSPVPLFTGLSLHLRRGERVALIGGNGTGKSTILKIIGGVLEPDGGEVRLGSRVNAGYYDQEQQFLHEEKTLFEEISDACPERTETAVRNTLAAFLFIGDDVFKQISVLSGGERARLSLAKLMLSGSNFLLLDEPTNHLDIVSREILEEALCAYTGTVLFVSHDRYFINRTATRILELEYGTLTGYPGNYDYYLEKKRQPEAGSAADKTISSGKTDWKEQKEQQAAIRRKQQRIAACEARIAELEDRDKEINACLLLPETGTDLNLCQQLAAEQEALRQELDTLYDTWEQLSQED